LHRSKHARCSSIVLVYHLLRPKRCCRTISRTSRAVVVCEKENGRARSYGCDISAFVRQNTYQHIHQHRHNNERLMISPFSPVLVRDPFAHLALLSRSLSVPPAFDIYASTHRTTGACNKLQKLRWCTCRRSLNPLPQKIELGIFGERGRGCLPGFKNRTPTLYL